jgi:hypothetical protein
MTTIDVLTPATKRPAVLLASYGSFRKSMLRGHDPRAWINVDPAGLDHVSQREMLNCARLYMGLEGYRFPSEAHFGRAFHWLWTRPVGKYALYLEDDWVLDVPVDLDEMVWIMDSEPDLAILRLPFRPTGPESSKNWGFFFPWNGRYFECPEHLRREVGFCGHPSLIRNKFIRETALWLDPEQNPEKQFHHGRPELLAEVDRWRYGVFAKPDQGAAVRDIGREWMAANGLAKAGSKAWFTGWRQAND